MIIMPSRRRFLLPSSRGVLAPDAAPRLITPRHNGGPVLEAEPVRGVGRRGILQMFGGLGIPAVTPWHSWWYKATGGAQTISFVGSATTNTSSINIGSTGRAAGDLCLLWNYAAKFGLSPPASVTPASFSAIGSSQTYTNSGVGVSITWNMWVKQLSGSETTLTLMSDGFQFDGVALIIHKSSGTWGSPASIGNQATFSPAPSPQTVTVGSAPLAVFGALASTDPDDLLMSPAYTGHAFDGDQLAAGYIIYNSSPVNNTVSGTILTNAAAIGSFYVPLGP